MTIMGNKLAQVDMALALAQQAMAHCATEGASLAAWRDDARMCCQMCGAPEPEDYLAWVSGGRMSDADVDACDGWGQAFSLPRIG